MTDAAERLSMIQVELKDHVARLSARAKALADEAARMETANGGQPTAESRGLALAGEALQEQVDTGLDFQNDVISVMREAIEAGIGGGEPDDVGLERDDADAILSVLHDHKALLTELLGTQTDEAAKGQLRSKLLACDNVIKLVDELVLEEDDDEDEDEEKADDEPN